MERIKGFSNAGGNVAIVTAISAAVLMGVVGVAVLVVQGLQKKTALQAALDSGVLAGTAMTLAANDTARIKVAEAAFYANIKGSGVFSADGAAEFEAGTGPTPAFTVNNTWVSGKATATVENPLGSALGITSLEVHVDAGAARQETDPMCALALNPNSGNSLYVYGNAKFDADCPVKVNSTDDAGGSITGHQSTATASVFGFTGKAQGDGWSPQPMEGLEPVVDPYASLPVPSAGACKMSDAAIKVSSTLGPGTYCGGLTVKSGATVILNPGIYIMLDGQFRIDSGGRVEGEEVLIALVGRDSFIYMGSDSWAKLTSPKDGTYKNIQFISDRDLSQSKFEEEWTTIFSGATLEYDGAMYLPEQNFWVSGTSHQAIIKGFSPSMAMVVDTIWVQGNALLELRQEDRRGIGQVEAVPGFAYGAKLIY